MSALSILESHLLCRKKIIFTKRIAAKPNCLKHYKEKSSFFTMQTVRIKITIQNQFNANLILGLIIYMIFAYLIIRFCCYLFCYRKT